MTLPSSGAITSTQIDTELGGTSGFVVPTDVRVLCRKPSGDIVWPNDFWGEALHPNVIDSQRFGATSSPGSTFTIPTVTGNGTVIGAGHLVIACQLAESTTATPPANVTPAGWTAATLQSTFVGSGGDGVSVKTWYKLLTAGMGGDVITGMSGTGKNRVAAMVYCFDKTPTTVTVQDTIQVVGTVGITTNPTNLSIGTQAAGTHIIFGAAHGETSMADADYAWNITVIGGPRIPGNSPKGATSQTRTYFNAYDNNQTVPATVRMDMLDQGTFNAISGCIFRVRN